MKVVIKPAKPSDLDTIEKMHEKRVFGCGLQPTEKLDGMKVFVAWHKGEIVGFCQLSETIGKMREANVNEIGVTEKFRGRGVGTSYLEKPTPIL